MGYGGGYDANYYWIIFPTFPNQLFPSIFTITCPRVISQVAIENQQFNRYIISIMNPRTTRAMASMAMLNNRRVTIYYFIIPTIIMLYSQLYY